MSQKILNKKSVELKSEDLEKVTGGAEYINIGSGKIEDKIFLEKSTCDCCGAEVDIYLYDYTDGESDEVYKCEKCGYEYYFD